ncbi:MAG TPA: M20/M25/M40 family metallo-hydrolase, partial [Candidatus Aphodousia gallistercoris]|nr:M20/M25/M40 family metallo-hydrolase [Candidatus Aphodousia gallistercoris]
SGLRALLQIIRSLNEADIQTEGDIYFVATVGEEGLGDIRGSKHFVATHTIDGFIAIDNTEIGRILKGAVGSHRYRVTIEGPGGHSYGNFAEVGSAIHAMCIAGNMIAHLKTPKEPKTTFTIGTITGGTSVNSIAPSCSVEIDMRSLDNDALLKIEAEILACFDKAVAEENAIWNITDPAKQVHWKKENIGNRPAGMRPADCPVLQVSRSALEALGQKLTNYGVSSTDANAPVSLGIPATCLSSGGFQYKCHTVHEYFDKIDIHLGPQLLILTAVGLVGCEGFRPILTKRNRG